MIAAESPNITFDFSECEAERIEAPGAIQSFGTLIVFDRVSGLVTHFSRNLAQSEDQSGSIRIGIDRTAVGAILGLPCDLVAATDGLVSVDRPFPEKAEAIEIGRVGTRGYFLSASPEHFILESRPSPVPPEGHSVVPTTALEETGGNIFALAQTGAETVKRLSGFDRVMIYRFAADWSGEVIAEACESDMIPYIGLHYPATDIPTQARRLFLANRMREIGDTMASTVPIDPACAAGAEHPLDLSTSITRAVSEYHLEYLSNMGVRATLTSALVVAGKLWGLIACHHRVPNILGCDTRAAVGRISDHLSLLIEKAHGAEKREAEIWNGKIAADLDASRDIGQNMVRALLHNTIEATAADGVAIVIDEDVVAMGVTPAASDIVAIARRLGADTRSAVFTTDNLHEIFDKEQLDLGGTCGAAAVALAAGRLKLVVFREEFKKSVSWGGDPSHPVHVDARTGKVSPRKSFETWSQIVSHRSRPWGEAALLFMGGLEQKFDWAFLVERGRDCLDDLLKTVATPDILDISLINAALDAKLLVASAFAPDSFLVLSANHTFKRLFSVSLDASHVWSEKELVAYLGLRPMEANEEQIAFRVWSPELGPRDIELVRRNVLDVVLNGARRQWFTYVFKDWTNVHRDRIALNVVRRRAEGQAAIATKFLAHMSHELRTPLNAILGYSEMIAGALLGPHQVPRYAQYGADINGAGQHLLSLIEQLLTFSQIEAGKRRLVEEVFELGALVAETVEWIRKKPGASGGPMIRLSPTEPFYLRADPVAVRQIAINIIGNAVKFTPSDASIEIDIGIDRTGGIAFTVSDRGPGIPANLIEQMFKPFQQAEDIYRRSLGGVGLGLAISKGLIELHGGTIRLRSRPAAGTEVTILFPAHRLERALADQ